MDGKKGINTNNINGKEISSFRNALIGQRESSCCTLLSDGKPSNNNDKGTVVVSAISNMCRMSFNGDLS